MSNSIPKQDAMAIRQAVLATLREWAAEAHDKGIAGSAYVFGSLVSYEGVEFDPIKSDIDLLVTFPSTSNKATDRAKRVEELAALTPDLEVSMMRVLKRASAEHSIVSINVVTESELALGIHKGGDASIYRGGWFLDLLTADAVPGPLISEEILNQEEHRAATFAAEGAQRYRNKFVRSTPNGARSVSPWDDEHDALPKDLARAAARLQYYVDGNRGNEHSVNAGYRVIELLIDTRKHHDPVFVSLVNWLAPRRGGRGVRAPLAAAKELLLWEILAEESEGALRRTSSVQSPGVIALSTQSALSLPKSDQDFWKSTIEMIVKYLGLKRWTWFIDSAVRELVHIDSFTAADELAMFSLSAVWPSEPGSLVSATKVLLDSYDKWISYYNTNAELRSGGQHYGPDKSFARLFNPRYHLFVEYEKHWADRCFWLLCKYVVSLNAFCNEVRQWIDPSFFRVWGNFLVVDTFGFRSNLQPSYYLPTAEDVEDGLQRTPAPQPIPPPSRPDERPRPWPIPTIPTPIKESMSPDASALSRNDSMHTAKLGADSKATSKVKKKAAVKQKSVSAAAKKAGKGRSSRRSARR